MSGSEWAGIALQVMVNAGLLIGVANRVMTRLAVIETRLNYLERAERPGGMPAKLPGDRRAQ